MKRYILTLCLCGFLSLNGYTQNNSGIEVGDKLPDLPALRLTHTKDRTLTSESYKGKFLILDFWATWCGPCIKALPKMDTLQEKFKDQLKIVLVSDETREKIDAFFATIKKIRNGDLRIGSVFQDTLLNTYFPHVTIPHYVWIDSNCIVRAITYADLVNDVNIQRFINNESLNLERKNDRTTIDADKVFFNEQISKALFVDSGFYGKEHIRYRSVLTKARQGFYRGSRNTSGRILGSSLAASDLFRQAFEYSFGKEIFPVHPQRLIYEVADKARFALPGKIDKPAQRVWLNENSYTYDLVLPDYYNDAKVTNGDIDKIRKFQCEIMKHNLESYFNVSLHLENRYVECLLLKSVDSVKHNPDMEFGQIGVIPKRSRVFAGRSTVSNLMMSLYVALQKEPVLVDDTNYSGPINIKLDFTAANLKSINDQLSEFGFTISRERRTLPMIVVRDRVYSN